MAERNSPVMDVMIAASMSRVAFLCLLAGGCAIAFAPIFVRLSDTGPLASAFWRCALAVPVLWAMAVIPVKTGTQPKGERRIGLISPSRE